jgi:4-hydroxy-tetrahydrodipicolinate synthase
LVERVCRQVQRRVPVLACVTDASAAASVELGQCAADAGADAVAMAPPFYFPLSQDELFAWCERQAAAMPLPMMLYNMPALTKVTFEAETVRRLADNRRLVGLKDSGGDLVRLRQFHEAARGRPDWTLLVGAEHLLAEAMDAGAHGGVVGGANVWPELFVRIYDAVRAGFIDELGTLASNSTRFGHIYTVGPFSVASVVKGLKAALAHLGVCSATVNPPLGPLSTREVHEIEKILNSLGLVHAADPAVVAQQQ